MAITSEQQTKAMQAVSSWVPVDVAEAIRKQAKAEERSPSWLIGRVLRDHFVQDAGQ